MSLRSLLMKALSFFYNWWKCRIEVKTIKAEIRKQENVLKKAIMEGDRSKHDSSLARIDQLQSKLWEVETSYRI